MEKFFLLLVVASLLSVATGEYKTSKCYGNYYMNSKCPENSGKVIAVKKLQYGMKSYTNDECPKNIEANFIHNTTCCQFEQGDCLKNITDYKDKYLYLSRLSRLTAISQNTATPRHFMECTNNSRTYSNYVQVVFDCVEGNRLKNFCSYQKLVSENGTVYLYREPYYTIKESCECRFESASDSTIKVFAIDVRLQPVFNISNSTYTGECPSYSNNSLTFNEGHNSKTFQCENSTIYAEYETMYSSNENVLNVTYTEDGPEAQQIWILVQASKGWLTVECNPELLTIATLASSPSVSGGITSKHTKSPDNNNTSGGHGHKDSNNIKATNIPSKKGPGPANPDHVGYGSGTSARAERRAVENTVLYTVIGVAAMAALLIIAAGVFIKRTRRSAEYHQRVSAIMGRSNSSILTLEKLPREIIGRDNSDYTDHLY